MKKKEVLTRIPRGKDAYGDDTFMVVSKRPHKHFCEHCGKMRGKLHFEGSTHWCLTCWDANGELKEGEYDELRKKYGDSEEF